MIAGGWHNLFHQYTPDVERFSVRVVGGQQWAPSRSAARSDVCRSTAV